MFYSRKIKIVAALFLTVLCVFMLSGCKTDKKTMAEWDGNTFISEWAGFKFTVPGGWYKASDEEIAEFNQLGAEAIAGVTGEDAEKYQAANAVYPFLISEYPLKNVPQNVVNTNVVSVFEKLNALQSISVKDAESYLEYTAEQLESLGFETEKAESRQIAGKEYASMTASINAGIVSMKQYYFTTKHDGYMISFIFTGSSTETSKIEDLIKSIEKI